MEIKIITYNHVRLRDQVEGITIHYIFLEMHL